MVFDRLYISFLIVYSVFNKDYIKVGVCFIVEFIRK